MARVTSDDHVLIVFLIHVVITLIVGIEAAPPRLNPDSSSMNIETGTTFKFVCSGSKAVRWDPKNYETIKERVSIDDFYNQEDEIYTSQLTLKDAVYSDTRSFSCFYVGSEDPSSVGNVNSIYVFVTDPENLLVSTDPAVILIRSNKETIIPCRPTSPAVDVRLKKMPDDDVSLESGDIRYDNRVGFVIMYATIFFSNQFECVAELDNKTSTREVRLHWMGSGKVTLPTPTIDRNGNSHIVIGGKFTFTCLINIDATTTSEAFLSWEYPGAKDDRITEGTTTTSKQHRTTSSGTITFDQLVKNLTVENVETSDEGRYSCTAKDAKKHETKYQIWVSVNNPEDTKLKLEADFVGQPNNVTVGTDRVRYIVNVQYSNQPGPPELIWMKNKELLLRDKTSKYEIERTDKKTALVLKNLNQNDTANYTLTARTDSQEKTVTLTLWVVGEPAVKVKPLKNTRNYHFEGERYEIICTVYSLPPADVTWLWQPCETSGCDSANTEIRPLSNGENREKIEKITRGLSETKSTLYVTANTSGYYSCKAENGLGKDVDTYTFVVTDAKRLSTPIGFGFTEVRENLIETDNATFQCIANKFNYTSAPVWIFKKEVGSVERTLENRTGLIVKPTQSKYSYKITAHFTSVRPADSGFYTCMAKERPQDRERRETRIVIVGSIESPRKLTTNMDGSHYPIEREQRFHFNCNVTGNPTPKIVWKKDNYTLDEESYAQFNFINDTILEIPRVVVEDTGTYYCNASNRAGFIVLNATLLVAAFAQPQGMAAHVKGIIIAVAVITILALIILSVILGRKCYYDRKERLEIYELEKMLFERGAIEQYNPDLPLDEQIDTLPYDAHWEFPRERLKLGKTLGQGAFGRVVKGEAYGLVEGEDVTPVAVKMLKEHASIDQRKAIMQELKIMIHLGRHINILNLLGACIQQKPRRGELLIIMEYCQFGNLQKYLLHHRSRFINQISPETGEIDTNITSKALAASYHAEPFSPTRTSSPTTNSSGHDGYLVPLSPSYSHTTAVTNICSDMTDEGSDESTGFGRQNMSMRATSPKQSLTSCDLVGFSFQIARGMEYLATRKLIHRDLAARNILLADGNIIKICDFGLTKDCYNKAYYRKKGDTPLPIKWMAIESIRDRTFSTESDVWSFGIVLWEIFSLGANPYPGFEVDENFYKKLLSGYRMDKPDHGTDDFYRIMSDCWNAEPSQRPTFSELVDQIGDQLQSGMREHYIELNTNYMKLYHLTTVNPDYINMNAENSLPDYVNVPAIPDTPSSEYEEKSATTSNPDYLEMRGSNTPSMNAYQNSRNELKPMLSDSNGVPLRNKKNGKNDHSPTTASRFPQSTDSNYINMTEKNNSLLPPKDRSLPPSYNSVMADEFTV